MSVQWYYQLQGSAVGPLPSVRLRQLALDGAITRDTLVKREGTEAWGRAAQIDELWVRVTEPPVANFPAPPPNPAVKKRPSPPRPAESPRVPGPLPMGPPPVTAELLDGPDPPPPARADVPAADRGETILVSATIHDWVFVPPIAVAAVAIVPLPLLWLLGGVSGFWIGALLSGCGFVAAGVFLVFALAERKTSSIVLTDRRLQASSGVLVRSFLDLPLDKVDAMEIRQDILGIIGGYGTLYISGQGLARLGVSYVCSPESVSEAITKAIAKHR